MLQEWALYECCLPFSMFMFFARVSKANSILNKICTEREVCYTNSNGLQVSDECKYSQKHK